jgi:hypothetical protein
LVLLPPTEPTTQYPELRLTLEAPARARTGEPVPLVFRVTNTSARPVTLQLLGRTPTADFQVSEPQGLTIWTRLRGQTMLGALRLHPLDAGEELVFRDVWNAADDGGNPVPAGEYLIRGVLLTDDRDGLASPATRLRFE